MLPTGNVDWLWNNPGNYNFVSGPLADITLITGMVIFLRKHNCHVNACWRLAWHDHPDHGHPVCKHHFPHEQKPDLSKTAHRNPPKREQHKTVGPHPQKAERGSSINPA